tara:strand:- start:1347 stop:1955 length:609 start_codon:yes stop_codon:yes gene_type:complete
MSSFTQIASNALQQLGAAPISDITENTGRAKRVNAIYQDVRDAVIRDAKWNCALERIQLAALADAPAFTWSKQHQLPENPYCLRVVQVYSGDDRVDHVIEGRKILSDYSTINLLYLKRVTDPSQFDALFVEAYEARLAAELAISITGSRGIAQDFWKTYDTKIMNARLVDSQEGTPAAIQANSLVDVRRRTFVVDDQNITIP